MKPLLSLVGVERTYEAPSASVRALAGFDVQLWPGEMVALMGPSGSGKSTALAIGGLLLRPTRGGVEIDGDAVPTDEMRRARVRNTVIGFVHQDYAVVEDLTGIDNVSIPLEYVRPRVPKRRRREKAGHLLRRLGIDEETARRSVAAMSGGQRQRVAIARALVNEPRVVLADEPTASLDSDTAAEVVDLFMRCKGVGRGVLVATHDERVAAACDRVVWMRDGVRDAGRQM